MIDYPLFSRILHNASNVNFYLLFCSHAYYILKSQKKIVAKLCGVPHTFKFLVRGLFKENVLHKYFDLISPSSTLAVKKAKGLKIKGKDGKIIFATTMYVHAFYIFQIVKKISTESKLVLIRLPLLALQDVSLSTFVGEN